MSQPTYKPASVSPKTWTSPKREANVEAPATLESEKVVAGIDDFVETLADLRTEVLLGALEASNRRKGMNMADRTLTADEAISKVQELSVDIKSLMEGEEAARTKVAAIRATVKVDHLEGFDDKLDELVNGKQ